MQKPPLQISAAGVIGTVLVLITAAVCVRLGFWQLNRLDQRRTSNAAISARIELPPLELTDVPADTAALLYRRVRLAGTYDTAHAFVLAGRSLRGNPGVYVFTPLRSSGGGPPVLVNRGWLPAADGASVDLAAVAVASEQLSGVILPVPPAPDDAVPPDTFRRVVFRFNRANVPDMPYPLFPAYVQALPDPGAQPSPRRLPLPALDNGPHMSYALQWFSFAVIAIVGFTILASRSRTRKNERGAEAPPEV